MLTDVTTLGSLTPIHTDFGNNRDDLLVVEYDVPQTKVKQTLFFKYGQLAIPKWALIPAGILAFGLLTALCAVMVNAILSQPITIVTYSQDCSKTSKCRDGVGLICGPALKCICPDKQYWYENMCTNQPTYTETCNQTTECRTDLGLLCTDVDSRCNCPNITTVQTCDCYFTAYWTGSACMNRQSYLGACSVKDSSYQCLSNLYCNGSMCICSPNTQYWNTTASACYSVDKYLNLCDSSTSYSCDSSVSLFCFSAGAGAQCPFNATPSTMSCDCANGTYWNGGSCVSRKTINTPCSWNCECNTDVGLQCLNLSCVCPYKYYWSTSTLPFACIAQKNYTQSSCYNTSQCDATQALTCYLSGSPCNCPTNSSINMCDCSPNQYYDYNISSCQKRELYNRTCSANYMCDTTVGLFCQLSISTATNCSCPEPIRLNMCDCNITSYWDGLKCALRLAPNVSCTYPYQCQANYTCFVNETDNGIFSDVCRCSLGYYYVAGSGCVQSINYSNPCVGSYQCYENASLSCRYNNTGFTCLANTSLPACDCQDYYYYNASEDRCLPLLNRFEICQDSCQCTAPYGCTISNQCDCSSYYSSLNSTCVTYLRYGDQCTNSAACQATPNANMTCVNGTCGCSSPGYWSGSQCIFTSNFRAICQNSNDCYSNLTCRTISCIDSNKRCSCPSNTYYSPSSQTCISSCTGPDNSYTKYVINFATSDACVGIRVPPGSGSGSSFATADGECTALTPMTIGVSPQLLSLHNVGDPNCIANLLNSVDSSQKCPKRLYYLGLNTSSMTFYDGTPYYPTFLNAIISAPNCLTFCLNNANSGSVGGNPCSGGGGGKRYGAICDYQII